MKAKSLPEVLATYPALVKAAIAAQQQIQVVAQTGPAEHRTVATGEADRLRAAIAQAKAASVKGGRKQ